MDFANLNRALKFAAGEQEAFEKLIDANPHESTAHHVYADWLEDNGQHKEAKFRRSMGDWMRSSVFDNNGNAMTTHEIDPIHLDDAKYVIVKTKLPEGVDREHIERNLSYPTIQTFQHRFGFHDYRTMENAFRQAFMVNNED